MTVLSPTLTKRFLMYSRLNLSYDLHRVATSSTAAISTIGRRFGFLTLSAKNGKVREPDLLNCFPALSRGVVHRVNNTTSRFMSSSVNTKIQNILDNNKVVIFSKTYCPFCVATKNLFRTLNVDAEVLELDLLGNEGVELQAALFRKTKQKSVPNVFVNGKHVGGNDDTQAAARNGTLQQMLDSA